MANDVYGDSLRLDYVCECSSSENSVTRGGHHRYVFTFPYPKTVYSSVRRGESKWSARVLEAEHMRSLQK